MAKTALPILAQGLRTCLVGFIDNIMVGQLGTEAMSGVAIANQLHFVYATCLLGIVAGGSVFGAQFYGNKNLDGFRESFRFRFLACLALSAIAFFLLWVLGERFLPLFLYTRGEAADADRTLRYGKQYLTVLLMGMVPYARTQVYASAMKDMGETLLPMIADITAILSNTALNYLLIFGNPGFSRLGVKGAAIATVLSRVIELAIILFALYRPESNFQSLHHSFGKGRSKTPCSRRIFVKGLPLMVNEFFWSIGTAIVLQCSSLRGIQVVAGLNIATSMYNIFTVVYQYGGGTVAIMTGQLIGAGRMQEARETNRKLFSVAVCLSVICGITLFAAAPFIPQLYATTPAVKILQPGLCGFWLFACRFPVLPMLRFLQSVRVEKPWSLSYMTA